LLGRLLLPLGGGLTDAWQLAGMSAGAFSMARSLRTYRASSPRSWSSGRRVSVHSAPAGRRQHL